MLWDYVIAPLLIVLFIYLPGYLVMAILYPQYGELHYRDERIYRTMLSFVIGIIYIIFSTLFLSILPPYPDGKGRVNLLNVYIIYSISLIFFLSIAYLRKSYIFTYEKKNPHLIAVLKKWQLVRYKLQLIHEEEALRPGESKSRKEKKELAEEEEKEIDDELITLARDIYGKTRK